MYKYKGKSFTVPVDETNILRAIEFLNMCGYTLARSMYRRDLNLMAGYASLYLVYSPTTGWRVYRKTDVYEKTCFQFKSVDDMIERHIKLAGKKK